MGIIVIALIAGLCFLYAPDVIEVIGIVLRIVPMKAGLGAKGEHLRDINRANLVKFTISGGKKGTEKTLLTKNCDSSVFLFCKTNNVADKKP